MQMQSHLFEKDRLREILIRTNTETMSTPQHWRGFRNCLKLFHLSFLKPASEMIHNISKISSELLKERLVSKLVRMSLNLTKFSPLIMIHSIVCLMLQLLLCTRTIYTKHDKLFSFCITSDSHKLTQ